MIEIWPDSAMRLEKFCHKIALLEVHTVDIREDQSRSIHTSTSVLYIHQPPGVQVQKGGVCGEPPDWQRRCGQREGCTDHDCHRAAGLYLYLVEYHLG